MSDDPALPQAIKLICQFEGFVGHPYQDNSPRKVWTIGYGMTYLPDGSPVKATTPPVTQQQALDMMAPFVAKTLASVRAMVHVPITDTQAAVLTSFSWNEGTQALRSSHLMLALNQGKTAEAAQCFAQYVYAGGKYNQGLVNRRREEAALFLSSTSAPVETVVVDAAKSAAAPVNRSGDGEMSADALMQTMNPSISFGD